MLVFGNYELRRLCTKRLRIKLWQPPIATTLIGLRFIHLGLATPEFCCDSKRILFRLRPLWQAVPDSGRSLHEVPEDVGQDNVQSGRRISVTRLRRYTCLFTGTLLCSRFWMRGLFFMSLNTVTLCNCEMFLCDIHLP